MKKKILAIKDLLPIREIKEEINLIMFNSNRFSTEDMKLNNQLMEAIANVKIQTNHSL
jgi:hypothetical protein